MSLAIQLKNLSAILLSDGWHQVKKESVCIDSYEFKDGDGHYVVKGGEIAGIPSTGIEWIDMSNEKLHVAPLTSVIAVRY